MQIVVGDFLDWPLSRAGLEVMIYWATTRLGEWRGFSHAGNGSAMDV